MTNKSIFCRNSFYVSAAMTTSTTCSRAIYFDEFFIACFSMFASLAMAGFTLNTRGSPCAFYTFKVILMSLFLKSSGMRGTTGIRFLLTFVIKRPCSGFKVILSFKFTAVFCCGNNETLFVYVTYLFICTPYYIGNVFP